MRLRKKKQHATPPVNHVKNRILAGLLVVGLLAVAALVGYLVVNPPGQKAAADDGNGRVPSLVTTTPAVTTTVAPTTTPPPPPPAKLSLADSCAGIIPMMDTVDTIFTAFFDDSADQTPLEQNNVLVLRDNLSLARLTAPDDVGAALDPVIGFVSQLFVVQTTSAERSSLDVNKARNDVAAVRNVCAG